VGGHRLKDGLFNRYVIVVILEFFRKTHAHLQSVTPALAHDPAVNYSTAPRPKRRGFKFEKNREKDATRSRKNLSDTDSSICRILPEEANRMKVHLVQIFSLPPAAASCAETVHFHHFSKSATHLGKPRKIAAVIVDSKAVPD
jgi:hypothetical protein